MTFLIVGLGNIGYEYEGTRHNMGFSVLDTWTQASNTLFTTVRYGDMAEIRLKGRTFVLLKPSTYMNLSGKAVAYWLDKKGIPVENLLVIADDMNLPFGTMRMRKGGSAGGHNCVWVSARTWDAARRWISSWANGTRRKRSSSPGYGRGPWRPSSPSVWPA